VLIAAMGGVTLPQFQMFRIKVVRGPQASLFESPTRTSDILRNAIESKPSAELRKGHTWHIGNVKTLDSRGVYFAIGRTTTLTVERYDPKRRDFLEEEFDTAPYTHVFLDLETQVAAIAAKARLARSAAGVARQLQRLLNQSPGARDHEITFDVVELKDPEDFIAHLRSAYVIEQFTFTFSRPNPFDVNQDFVKPLERFLSEARGEQGKAAVTGSHLDSGVLEEVARSAAASGDDAEARLRTSESEGVVKKRLSGNPVILCEDDPDTLEKKKNLLAKLRKVYARLRAHAQRGAK